MNVRGSSQIPPHSVRKAELVMVGTLVVGDRISEVDSPQGPWYPVLRIDGESVTIDGRATSEEPELPVTLGYASTARVLRRPA